MIKSILSIAIAFLFSLQIFGQEAANTIKLNYSQEEFKKAKESLSFTFEVSSEELGKKMLENTEKFYNQFFTLKQEGKTLKVKFNNLQDSRIFYRLLKSSEVNSLFFDRILMSSEDFLKNNLN